MNDVHARKRHDIYTSQRRRGAGTKSAAWDLSVTRRYRQQEEVQFLSRIERRYLKDVLASLEQSGKDLTGAFPIRAIRLAFSAVIRFAQPLQGLVARGLVGIITRGKRNVAKLHGVAFLPCATGFRQDLRILW
jgi:hypothetical protein